MILFVYLYFCLGGVWPFIPQHIPVEATEQLLGVSPRDWSSDSVAGASAHRIISLVGPFF